MVLSLIHIYWNALNGDAETGNPTIEFEMQRLQETVGNKNSVVILMHDAQACLLYTSCTGGILQISKAVYEGTKAGLEVIKRVKQNG